MQQINAPSTRSYMGVDYTEQSLSLKSSHDLKGLYNMLWDILYHDEVELGAMKRRRKWESDKEAVAETWKILGIMNGEIDMADEKTTPKPTPKCYSSEVVKRPTRKMFMRIKKVGEPDKSQRPFAWGQFKNGMRLIDIKEDENLHAGKITFWMRQNPPLIELEDISDDKFQKELDAWYESHGLKNPEAEKREKAAEREKAKAERAKEREAKAAEREKAKAEKAKAAAEKKEAAEKAKAEKAKAKAAAPKAKAAPAAKKKAAAA